MSGKTHHEIPFTTFRGKLKQLRLDDIEPVKARLFRETFPRFFDVPKPPADGEVLKQQIKALGPKFVYTEESDLRRRLAGEPTLGRGCYYSVCCSDTGGDGGTLQNEVRAYRDPLRSGRVTVQDMRLQANPFMGESMDALLVAWRSPAHSPLVEQLLGSARDDAQRVLVLEFPYEVMDVVVDNVLDLRRPHVRRWFAETFSSDQEDGSITWLPHRMLATFTAAQRQAMAAVCITRPSRFRVESRVPPIPRCFAEMLPTLVNPDLGGGSSADSGSSLQAIGTWMRQNDVAALVYPSARSDVTVEIAAGELVASSGWNFVDYRNHRPSMQIRSHYFEQSPWCWTGFSPGIRFEGEADGCGSFRLTGVTAYWARDYEGLLAAREAVGEQGRGEAWFTADGKLTILGAWRLGAASIEWLRKNCFDRDDKAAIRERDLFKGFLLRLDEIQKVGLIDDLSVILPETQDLVRGLTECMCFIDDLAKSLASASAPEVAAVLVSSNRLQVLRFFISHRALALAAGLPQHDLRATVSGLLGEFASQPSGLRPRTGAALAALFARGLALLARTQPETTSELSECRRWLDEVDALDVGKEAADARDAETEAAR